eukprot:scaffold6160_cov19-Tisochrysis_lutea.AAC.1
MEKGRVTKACMRVCRGLEHEGTCRIAQTSCMISELQAFNCQQEGEFAGKKGLFTTAGITAYCKTNAQRSAGLGRAQGQLLPAPDMPSYQNQLNHAVALLCDGLHWSRAGGHFRHRTPLKEPALTAGQSIRSFNGPFCGKLSSFLPLSGHMPHRPMDLP